MGNIRIDRTATKRILIISMTRMGDLLQTTPLLAGLKQKYPGCELTLLVNKGFVEICPQIPFVDKIYTFDLNEFIPRLANPDFSLIDNYRYLERVIKELKKTGFDLVLNLTHSRASAVIVHLLDVPDTRGLKLDRQGYQIIEHPWMNYFFTAVKNREFNQYNLVDVHCKCGDIRPNSRRLYLEIPPEAQEFSERFLARHGISEQNLVIGFQPGASQEDKRWPAESFARLAELLNESRISNSQSAPKKGSVKIILFGAPNEKDIGEQIESLTKAKLVNAIGKTNLAQLSALLKRCDLLITNDTGTMHIACAVGTKVIALFMGSVLSFETGPYGEGNLVLEANIPCAPCNHHLKCKNPVCKEYIRPEDVLEAVKLMLTSPLFTGKNFGNTGAATDNLEQFRKVSSLSSKRVRFFYTTFDSKGMLDFVPLLKQPLTKAALFNSAYRQMWPMVLDSPTEIEELALRNGLDISSEHRSAKLIIRETERLVKRCQSFYELEGIEKLISSVQDDIMALEKLIALSEKGLSECEELIRTAQRPLNSAEIQHAKEIGKKILKLDEQIRLLGVTHRPIRPLTMMFTFGKANLQDKELFPLAVRSSRLYRFLHCESLLLHQLVTGCLKKLAEHSGYLPSFSRAEMGMFSEIPVFLRQRLMTNRPISCPID